MTTTAPSTNPAVPALPLYTVDEYFGLVESGHLSEDDRTELLEGVIVDMSPQTERHSVAVELVADALREAFPDFKVRTQRPFIASTRSGPEPDAFVARGRARDFLERHPSEALLVVEVAHTTLRQDRLTKSRIYAAAGVPEYWVVNLRDELLEVYRSPGRKARAYREIRTYAKHEAVHPLQADNPVAVADLLP